VRRRRAPSAAKNTLKGLPRRLLSATAAKTDTARPVYWTSRLVAAVGTTPCSMRRWPEWALPVRSQRS
jgi:hypothetical protein